MMPSNDRHRGEAIDKEVQHWRPRVPVELRIRLLLELRRVDSRPELVDDDHAQASKRTFHRASITLRDTKRQRACTKVQQEPAARSFEASDVVVVWNLHRCSAFAL
jgi:hypothetical protein